MTNLVQKNRHILCTIPVEQIISGSGLHKYNNTKILGMQAHFI